MKIEEIYTITAEGATSLNNDVKRIVKDLQSDGHVVEIQFSTAKSDFRMIYSAMIIGRKA